MTITVRLEVGQVNGEDVLAGRPELLLASTWQRRDLVTLVLPDNVRWSVNIRELQAALRAMEVAP